jgi:Flp pilus assembly protein protease CpaA
VLVTAIEGPHDSMSGEASKLADSFHWGITTVMGAGDASYVTSPAGYVVSWLLVLFGVAMVAAITGALHSATLLAISRNGSAYVNPPTDFRLSEGDDAVVVAESLGTLAPLRIDNDA